MADPYVRNIGHVEDADGYMVAVGVDYDTVTLGVCRLNQAAQEQFAQLYVSAVWQAARQQWRPPDEERPGDGRPDFEALAREMLATFIKVSDGHRARVGQVQIAKWTEQLEEAGDA